MLIVADENIPFVQEAFGRFGRVRTLPGRALSRRELREAEVLLVRSVTRVDERLLAGTRVRFVGTATIGTDHLDEEYLKKAGIAYASAPGSNACSVADYLTAAVLVLAGRLGLELPSLTAAVVGCGNVGSRVVKRLRALGLRVLENDPPLREKTGGECFLPLQDVLPQADLVTLHVPLTRSGPHPTFHLADERFLCELLRPGAIFINTSRGKVVDEAALLYARRVRRLRAVVLDVFHDEPDVSPEILEAADIATPHIAGYALDGKARGTMMLHEALARFLGEEPSWRMEEVLPEPPLPVIELDPGPEAVARAVAAVYDIEADDRKFRRLPLLPRELRAGYFDRLRKEYPVRREFRNTTVRFRRPAPPALVETLETLTFRVENPA